MTPRCSQMAVASLGLALAACAPSTQALQSTVEAAVALTQNSQAPVSVPDVEANFEPTLPAATPFPTATTPIVSGAGAPRAGTDPTPVPTALPAPLASATAAQATLRDHGTIQGEGSAPLRLAANEIAIGTADRYQDNRGTNNPPFTVFVIYGPYEGTLGLTWGGWDRWADASPEFIASQVENKISEVTASHPDDYATRRIRVLECRGDVLACVEVRAVP